MLVVASLTLEAGCDSGATLDQEYGAGSNKQGQIERPAKLVGPELTVFDWSEDACTPSNLPDNPARAFRDDQGQTQLLLSHYVNNRMVGPDLDHLRLQCGPILSSQSDPRPSQFNDRQWISSVYTLDGKKIFALVHDEYQGHTHPNRCPSGQYRNCWYNAITLAVSTNAGRSFAHARAPSHLIATLPYRYAPDTGPTGLFSPSNIVYRPADHYYYAFLQIQQQRDQPRSACLMRTRNLADPKSWRAWNGSAFSVSFIDPYQKPNEPPAGHVCQPVAPEQIQQMSESVTFNEYFGRFMLVGVAGAYDPGKAAMVWGVYYSLSDDLVHWDQRKLIMAAEMPWTYQCGDPDPIAYPAVLDPKSRSRNFETSGKRAYLYFTRFHYASCQMVDERDLVRVPIEFSK